MNRTADILALVVTTSLVTGCGTEAQFRPRAVGAQAVLPVGDLIANGRTNFALNNVALALENFRRAIRLQPENVDALNGIAACYDRLGRYDLSRDYYERALAIAPDNARTIHNFQISLNLQGKRAEAMALARPSVPTQPQAPVIATSESYAAVTRPELPPSAPARPADEPVAPRETGPHLERLSLSEVELVTSNKSQPVKQARTEKPRAADRVVQVTRAERVRQTSTSSEWVFPAVPIVAPAIALALPPSKPAEAAPAPAPASTPVMVTVPAPKASPAPQPAAARAPEPVVAPTSGPKWVTAPAATPAPRSKPVAVASAPMRAARYAGVAVRAPAPAPRLAATPTRLASVSPLVRPAKPAAAPAPRKAASVTVPRVRVLNAVGRKGLAGRYTRYLEARGWAQPMPAADARRMRNATVILYPEGQRAQAAALARRLPFRTVLAPSRRRGTDLQLLLGNDSLVFDNRLRQRIARA